MGPMGLIEPTWNPQKMTPSSNLHRSGRLKYSCTVRKKRCAVRCESVSNWFVKTVLQTLNYVTFRCVYLSALYIYIHNYDQLCNLVSCFFNWTLLLGLFLGGSSGTPISRQEGLSKWMVVIPVVVWAWDSGLVEVEDVQSMVVSGFLRWDRYHRITQSAIYKWYILPIGGLYNYTLPETNSKRGPLKIFSGGPLEVWRFRAWKPWFFRGELLVLGSVKL